MKKFNLSKGLVIGLLTLALCFVCFGVTKASAETGESTSSESTEQTPAAAIESITYDPATDAIVITTNLPKKTVYLATAKEASGIELNGKGFKMNVTTSDSSEATVVLSAKNKIKTAENKDAYIIATVTKPGDTKDDKKNFEPFIAVKKTDVKKIVVNFDYSKAAAGAEGLGISSLDVTPTEGDKYSCSSLSGDAHTAEWADLIGRLQFSTNGTTWYNVQAVGTSSESAEPSTSSASTAAAEEEAGFTLDYLYKQTLKAKAPKFQFRLLGTANDSTKTYVRTSKVFKVSVKKAGNPVKKLAINPVTNGIVIKNGFDFAAYSGSGESAESGGIATWYTVLPAKTGGTAPNTILATADFVPYKKPVEDDANSKLMFTETKVKEVALDQIETLCHVDFSETAVDIYVRKSAGVGKPASKWSAAFTIKKQNAAPTPSAKSGEIATSDKKNVLKGAFSGSGSTLEILVLDSSAVTSSESGLKVTANINWAKTKWTKYNASKGIQVEKTSSKVAIGDTAEKVTLDKDSYVLVRYAGDKKNSILTSEYTITKITSSTSGEETTYKWVTGD